MINIKEKKKIKFTLYIFIGILLFLVPDVSALENKLYFTNSGDRLYYNTEYYDDQVFMRHLDMIPGSTFTDELKIENNSLYTYKLYLKVKEVEGQSEEALELLDYIKMTIYHDGNLIYSGFARGLDYSEDGVNLQNAIYIGEYTPDKISNLLVDTELLVTYSNTENRDISYIDWEFVASYEDLVLPIAPDTGGDIFKEDKKFKILVISLSILLFIIIVTLIVIDRKKREI